MAKTDLHSQIPNAIECSIKMATPNKKIVIHKGQFGIKNSKKTVEIDLVGEIFFQWVPVVGCFFQGQTERNEIANNAFNLDEEIEVFLNNELFGIAYFMNRNINFNTLSVFFAGQMRGDAVSGDKAVEVDKILFSIPNFRAIGNSHVSKKAVNRSAIYHIKRNILQDDRYQIKIDSCINSEKRQKLLDEKGGYLIQYCAELTSLKGSLGFNETKELLESLSDFLSFLNGKRTSSFFHKGIHNNKTIWIDYSDYSVSSHKYVRSWVPRRNFVQIDLLWKKFRNYWANPDSKDFFNSVIHWYIDANNHLGSIEGAIIMSQAALELIYNWWIVEDKKMLTGKDSKDISAANKIRLLLSQLNVKPEIPLHFKSLKFFEKSEKEISDSCDAIVQLRNYIVHSQKEKRKKFKSLHQETLYHALQLSLYYTELSILRILEYDGVFYSRIHNSIYEHDCIQRVPWAKDESA